MTSEPTIDYEALQQEAMRSVVKSVLKETERSGLPGEHHFYISFSTQAPGVILSRRLREKYPHEMTIVLQHRFWGLVVTDDRFEVNLTFDSIPERLVVPFQAIRVFVDPSVRYGLQFETADIGPDPVARTPGSPFADLVQETSDKVPQDTATRGNAPRKARAPRRSAKSAERAPAAAGERAKQDVPVEAGPASTEPVAPAAQAANGPAKVVNLDAFRKR